MSTEISYHIVDFKVGEDNEIKILELGNAFYCSDLSERHSVYNNHEAMLKHAGQYGSLEIKLPVFRSFRHSIKNGDLADASLSLKNFSNASLRPKIYLVRDRSMMLTAGMEFIQEQHDEFLENGDSNIIFDGSIDSFYLCDRNKRILNKILQLNKLQQSQPETWFYTLGLSEEFVPPSDIPFFIIKPMNASLGEGVLLVANEDLSALLSALKTGSEFPKDVGDIEYYRRKSNRQVLIQRFYPGKTIVHQGQNYRPTARAVFAVVKRDDELIVDIIDIFWKLPANFIQTNSPTPKESVSYSGNSRQIQSQISLERSDYELVEKQLKKELVALSTAIYNDDIKGYLYKLYEMEQFAEIKYYLDYCPRQRVRRLDPELITLILRVDEKKAKAFLVIQAQYFALPWHLNFKNTYLKTWIEENLTQLEPSLLQDLQKFFEQNKNSIASSQRSDKEEVIQESDAFLKRISEALKTSSEKMDFNQSNGPHFFSVKSLASGHQNTSDLESSCSLVISGKKVIHPPGC